LNLEFSLAKATTLCYKLKVKNIPHAVRIAGGGVLNVQDSFCKQMDSGGKNQTARR